MEVSILMPEIWQMILDYLRVDPTITACVRVCSKWRRMLTSEVKAERTNRPGKVGSKMIVNGYYNLLAWAISSGLPTTSTLLAAAAIYVGRNDIYYWLVGSLSVCPISPDVKLKNTCPVYDVTYVCARVMNGETVNHVHLEAMSKQEFKQLYIHALLSDKVSYQCWLNIIPHLSKLGRPLVPAIKLKRWEVIRLICKHQQIGYVEEVLHLIKSDYPYWNELTDLSNREKYVFGHVYATYALELGKPEIARLFGNHYPYLNCTYQKFVSRIDDDTSEYKIAW